MHKTFVVIRYAASAGAADTECLITDYLCQKSVLVLETVLMSDPMLVSQNLTELSNVL